MGDGLTSLEPGSLWDHFASIAAIPRPSRHEQKIAAWVESVATEHRFRVRSDGIGNLVIDVPASAGHTAAPTVILQAHLDMVCEKNETSDHDFLVDAIRTHVDGDWVMARGTTLGADNGLGVAAALAVATDPSVTHGPLQLLFTLDEETGMTGAAGLDGSLLAGKLLINLDSEEDGVLFVGCAGGADAHLRLDPRRRPPTVGRTPRRLRVCGLRGGHSGLDIHENRGNALKLLARILTAAIDEGFDFDLVSLAGGSMHNAIPREASATLRLDPDDDDRFRTLLSSRVEEAKLELAGIDDGLEIGWAETPHEDEILVPDDRDRLLGLLMALPHGPLGMSREFPGLVETSSCLAVVKQHQDEFRIVVSGRSSVGPTLRAVVSSIRSIAKLAGVTVEIHDGYPGWRPDMSSNLLAVARRVYARVWGGEPEVTAVHAGLECGLLAERAPGLEMISVGPEIRGAHSPDERVSIPSVGRFWTALKFILADLAAER